MKPTPTLEAVSSLTDRYQTTVPEPVRRVLRLGKRDRIRYLVLPDGTVQLQRVAAADEHDDPAVGAFLDFVARDLQQHPERLRSYTPELQSRIHALVGDLDVDLDSTLSADDE